MRGATVPLTLCGGWAVKAACMISRQPVEFLRRQMPCDARSSIAEGMGAAPRQWRRARRTPAWCKPQTESTIRSFFDARQGSGDV